MTSQADQTDKQRQTQMLRTLKAGSRVRGTIRGNYYGHRGKVLDPNPFESDGHRRVRVQWDNGNIVRVLPSSIEELPPMSAEGGR